MKRLVRAASDVLSTMTAGEFIDQVKSIYGQYFPNSECYAQNLKVMGMEYIQIKWYLSKDASECAYNIRQNDLLSVAFNIDLLDTTESGRVYEMSIYDNSDANDVSMPSTITLDVMEKYFWVAPADSNYVYEGKRLPYRKTTGSPEKILSVLDRYAQILYRELTSAYNAGDIPEKYQKLVESKLQ